MLFATSLVQDTYRQTATSRAFENSLGNTFEYNGVILTPENPRHVVIGTTGTADLILLKTPFRDFSNYVCMEGNFEPSLKACAGFVGGFSGFNHTILESYLQTRHPQIAYSQTIVDQNVTLNYPVTSTTEFTIILTQLGPGNPINYWEFSSTNQTLTYPLLGYSERPGTFWSLPTMSLGLIAGGAITLAAALIQSKPALSYEPKPYDVSATRICPRCGRENLFFSAKCHHCGVILDDASGRLVLSQ